MAQRMIDRQGRTLLATYGLPRRWFGDLYHLWLTVPWWRAIGLLVGVYFVANAFFAVLYQRIGGIENANGSFSDAFFFSVQTLATIGYGRMSPVTLGAHLVVTVEALCGLVGAAMATGLMFAKFARPTARVLWSDVAVVADHDGIPSLMFRVANARGNQVVEAQLRVGMLRSEITREGESIRRQHDLQLVRASSTVFMLSWLAIHRIVPGSPLYGETVESLRAVNAEIYCSLTGLDSTFNQTIHARRSYNVEEVLWGRRFVDIIGPLPDGRMGVDYQKFHDTKSA